LILGKDEIDKSDLHIATDNLFESCARMRRGADRIAVVQEADIRPDYVEEDIRVRYKQPSNWTHLDA
jgi:hypothetical protein